MKLQEYLTIAKKMISKYGYKSMLKDDEAIGIVASSLMTADWKFNGIGTLEGFRSLCAKFTILSLKNKLRKKTISINNYNSVCSLLSYNDFDYVEYNDLLEDIENNEIISSKALDMIKSVYLDSESYQTVGNRYNVTRQYVEHVVSSSLQKLRKYYNVVS